MDFDILPDDVVAKIFSLLPPLMLLDSVPLVCKRWYQLCRHPDSWRNFNFVIPDFDQDLQQMQVAELTRYAKVAPYFNCIDVSHVVELTPQVTTLVNFLLEGHKTVKIIRTFETSTKRMRAFTKKMIEKYTDTLRAVYITFVSPDNESEEFHTSVNKLLTLVSQLPLLQTLGFDILDVGDFKHYGGQLGKGCPSLKKFVVDSTFPVEEHLDSFIFDVLETKKDQLQEIHFHTICENIDRFMDAIGNCRNVETLKIPIGYLPVLKHMSKLQSLELCFDEEHHANVIAFQAELPKLLDSLVLRKLKKLSLCCLKSTKITKANNPISNCIKELAQRSKGIEVFCVSNLRAMEKVVNLFLSVMKNVHTVVISDCFGSPFGSTININSKKLKHLQILKAKFLEKSDEEEFENLLQKLKLSLPELVLVSNYECYDDTDEDDASWDEDDFDYYYNYDLDYDEDEHEFTYFDYLRNKYGEDLSDSELYAFMSSDED